VRSKTTCPKCRAEIPLEDVNVATDVALCRQCGETWSYVELLADSKAVKFNFLTPPSGAWFREQSPNSFEVGVTTRSAVAFFLVPFMCVWSGFSLGAIYGTQVVKREFNLGMSLFGTPFILGSLLFGTQAVMAVCGKVVVSIDGNQGILFMGVGPIGWRRRFDWRNVSAVRRTETYGRRGSVSQQITLEGDKRLDFAGGLKSERLEFMFEVLRKKWRESHS
jgi:hypothetical protein